MKVKIGKRVVSVLLTITMIFSMVTVGMLQITAATIKTEKVGGVKDFFVDKAVDVGMRLICEGIITLSESAEEKGNDGIAKTTAIIAEWGFMNADEAAASKAVEYCEEILKEVQELKAIVNSNDAAIQKAVGDLTWFEGKTTLSDAKTNDITNVIADLSGELGILDKFEIYANTKTKYINGEATGEALEKAQLEFLHSLCFLVKSDEEVDPTDFESIGNVIFTNETVNSTLFNIIGKLSSNLIIDLAHNHDYNVMSYAMAYAYNYYPFSHQQYAFVMQQATYQLDTLIEIMTMYNEVLAFQYQYLTECSVENADMHLKNYNSWVDDFYGTDDSNDTDYMIYRVSQNIYNMLGTTYQVSPTTYLSLSDFMKLEDAVGTTLDAVDIASAQYYSKHNTFYKLMTNTDTSKRNVYYLWDYNTPVNALYSVESDDFTNELFKILCSDMSDGYNTFYAPTSNDMGKFEQLFNTNAYTIMGSTIKNYLYDFDKNGNSYSLLYGDTEYLFTSTYALDRKDNIEFQLIPVASKFTTPSQISTQKYKVYEDDYAYTSALYYTNDTYSQQVSLECVGIEGLDIKLESNNVNIGAGDSAIIPSGNKIKLKFKVSEDNVDFSLYCNRNHDAFNSKSKRTSSTLLLTQDYAQYLNVDEEGYYTLEYTMPYSECKFVLYSDDFNRDDDGRVTISCYDDLKAVSDKINSHPEIFASYNYVVTKDFTVPDNSSLAPIGTDYAKFIGTFDGQNHIINNLNFNGAYNYSGLIGYNQGTVQNIKFTNADIDGNYVGAACGYNNGNINNITVLDSKIDGNRNVGGICGKLSAGTISNCIIGNSDVSLNKGPSQLFDYTYASGGIVGYVDSKASIESCHNSATVNITQAQDTGWFSCIGGIAGTVFDGSIKLCSNSGSVKSMIGDSMMGGICGAGSTVTIANCGNNGFLSATDGYCAGILGYGFLQAEDYRITISNCYSSCGLSDSVGSYGGLLGGALAIISINNCYYNSDIFNGNVYQENGDYTLTNVEMKTTEQFKSGEVAYLLNNGVTDGTQAWYQNIDNDFTPDSVPVLVSNGENTVYKVNLSDKIYSNYENGLDFDELDKDENGSFIIRTYADLCTMAKMVKSGDDAYTKGSYILANDITCPSDKEWTTPIGLYEVPFKGTFDGQGYTISSLTSTNTNQNYFGLFGYINGAELRNVNVEVNFNLAGNSDSYIGGLCGYAATAINSDTDEKTVSKIYGCIVSGTINVDNAEYLGGICGYVRDDSMLECCINKSEITSTDVSWLGGVAGVSRGLINNCANWGDISCTDGWRAGGINAGDASVFNVITNCYNVGNIIGAYSLVDDISPNKDNISNCYYLISVNTTAGKTAEQFASGEVAYLLNNGVTDGTQVWYQNIDNGLTLDSYPVLVNNDKNTVYKVDLEDKTYSNYPKEELDPSLLKQSDLRTYQRIVQQDGTLSEKSQIAMGYGLVDNNEKVITVYMANTAERMGVLMHQGVDGKKGVLKLQGDYPKYSKTSGELLSDPNFAEPDIYTDGNGCIFISQPEDDSQIPELTVKYTSKILDNSEPVFYTLKVEIVDSSIFAPGSMIGGTLMGTLDKNDPDYNVIHTDSDDSNKEENHTSIPDEPSKNTQTGIGVVKTGNPVSGVIFLSTLLAGFVFLFVYRRKFNN